jgi:hypothetical protein
MLGETPLYKEMIVAGLSHREQELPHCYALVLVTHGTKDNISHKGVAILCSTTGDMMWYPAPPSKALAAIAPENKKLEDFLTEMLDMTFYGLERKTFDYSRLFEEERNKKL